MGVRLVFVEFSKSVTSITTTLKGLKHKVARWVR